MTYADSRRAPRLGFRAGDILTANVRSVRARVRSIQICPRRQTPAGSATVVACSLVLRVK